MESWKQILIGGLAGCLMTGLGLGGVGYLAFKDLSTEKTALQIKLKQAALRHADVSETQSELQAEIEGLKAQKAKAYGKTIDSLIQAKEHAGIDAMYEIGIRALQAKDYAKAYFALAGVKDADPAYKDVKTHYPAAKKAYDVFQKKTLEEKLSSNYARAVDHQIKGQFAQAQAAYRQVVSLNPSYRDSKARLNVVSQQLSLIQASREAEQKKRWLEASYQLAIKEQALGRLSRARDTYAAIVFYAPKYKDAAQRLKSINARLPKPSPPATQQVAAGNPQCYQKGVAFGNCAKAGAGNPACQQPGMNSIPPECMGNPEFQKGMSSVISQTRQDPQDFQDSPDIQNTQDVQDSQNTLNLLKNLPSVLKNL
ncbi:MAG: hypothetical protein CVV27_13880 [Candidatus Melainabacteria bacterium HGW-Melainabacteria-1]|nr:MAG: hypothetical protein CVV27_13880 [Candidatus Melainabacteria bacterium HGW-Melainabacteria-1]